MTCSISEPENSRRSAIWVEEAVADIVASHVSLSRKLRRRFENELAEFDALVANLASFTDTTHIARLAAKDDEGKELRAYLAQCLASHAKRTAVLERITRIAGQVINLERAIWRLDEPESKEETPKWEDILSELKKPLAPQVLPANVLGFERKIEGMNRRKSQTPADPAPTRS